MLESPGGEEMEEGEEEPQDEEPEFVDDTEFVLCLPAGGIPWASLLFTVTWDPLIPKVGRPIVRAGLAFLPFFFCLLRLCFSPSFVGVG